MEKVFLIKLFAQEFKAPLEVEECVQSFESWFVVSIVFHSIAGRTRMVVDLDWFTVTR